MIRSTSYFIDTLEIDLTYFLVPWIIGVIRFVRRRSAPFPSLYAMLTVGHCQLRWSVETYHHVFPALDVSRSLGP